MKSNRLIFIDSLFCLILIPISLLFRIKNKLIKLIFRRYKIKDTFLIVKFLGAGNFIAYSQVFKDKNITIVSSISNVDALNKFLPNIRLLLINDRSLLSLFISSFWIICQLFFECYSIVINMESESSFSKFICSIPLCDKLNGLSNKYKSIYDWLFYDFFLVSPVNMGVDRKLIILMDNNSLCKVNPVNFYTIYDNSKITCKAINNKNLLITPTCSITDKNRRLPIMVWEHVLNCFCPYFETISISFPSNNDSQYKEFIDLKRKIPLNNVQLIVEQYDDFVYRISNSDLLITIDSQALHIAQEYSKDVIAFYGPTSPYGVRLISSTIVVSKNLECSPCTHKYFREPCNGVIGCMRYGYDEIIEIRNNILNL